MSWIWYGFTGADREWRIPTEVSGHFDEPLSEASGAVDGDEVCCRPESAANFSNSYLTVVVFHDMKKFKVFGVAE